MSARWGKQARLNALRWKALSPAQESIHLLRTSELVRLGGFALTVVVRVKETRLAS